MNKEKLRSAVNKELWDKGAVRKGKTRKRRKDLMIC